MKKYSDVLTESVELYEIFGRRRNSKRIEQELEAATKKGPSEVEKKQVSLAKEIILGFLGAIRNHPRKFLITLGLVLGDMAQSSFTGRSATGYMLGKVADGVNAQLGAAGEDLKRTVRDDMMTKDNFIFLGQLAAVGFSAVAIFNLLKIVAVRGPKWLEAKLATRDNKQLAYIMKKELGVDIHTQDVRVGSPGRSRITDVER